MQLKLAAGLFPAIIIYTDHLPEQFGGMANGPVIRIRPKYINDEGLHAHELTHVYQWYLVTLICAAIVFASDVVQWLPLCVGIFPLAYECIPKVRLWAELMAYKAQASFGGNSQWMADALATKYGDLGITSSEAMSMLE